MLNYSVAQYRVNAAGLLVPYCFVDGELKEVAWAPLPGSQTAFLQCCELEVLFEGTRGGCGKTLALIMDFLQFVGLGLGAEHRGIIFRRTFPQLADMIALSRIWIPKIYPDAIYNEMQQTPWLKAYQTRRSLACTHQKPQTSSRTLWSERKAKTVNPDRRI